MVLDNRAGTGSLGTGLGRLERPKAEERKCASQNNDSARCGCANLAKQGEARDKVANAVGMSPLVMTCTILCKSVSVIPTALEIADICQTFDLRIGLPDNLYMVIPVSNDSRFICGRKLVRSLDRSEWGATSRGFCKSACWNNKA